MSDNSVTIRFDGPILADHSMDVTDLAPALLALADVCKNANRKFNGDRAAVKVLVNAKVEQHCFELVVELAMTVMEQVRSFLDHDHVRSAKEILEWIGIIGGASIGLVQLIAKLGSKPIEKVEYRTIDNRNIVSLTIVGDDNDVQIIHAAPETYELLKDASNIKAVKRLVEPLTRDGYETLTFEHSVCALEVISKAEAGQIAAVDPVEMADQLDEKEEPQTVVAWVKVYSPVYEQDAKRWRFLFSGNVEYMDITDTPIAEMAMQRGGALVNDTYRVRLQMTQSKSSTRMTYKILEVLEFHPAALNSQIDLF